MYSLLIPILVLIVAPTTATYGGEVIRADHSETIRTSSGLLRLGWGGVSIVDSIRGISILADSANIWISADSARAISRARLSGNVVLKDVDRSVRSKALEYDPRNETAVFSGSVLVEEAGKVLSAGHVAYDRKTNSLASRESVRLLYAESGLVVVADELGYTTGVDSGRAQGNTRVARHSGGTDSLIVSSRWLWFRRGGDLLHFGGDVEVIKSNLTASADTAVYSETSGILELTGHPKAGWVENVERDTVEMSGDRLSLLFGERIAERVTLMGNTRIRMVSIRDSIQEEQNITADTSVVDIDERFPVSMVSSGNVAGNLESDTGTLTELDGVSTQFAFRNGTLDSLLIQDGEVDYRTIDGEQVSRLSGARILLSFRGGEIRNLLAEGGAKCEHTDDKIQTGEVRLTGDRVELSFEKGELIRASAYGGVRGSYERGTQEVVK